MSNSAITLQCPSCGGIFLTLQQSSGPMEICPHCAVSSPRNLFLPAQGAPQPRHRTTLPSRRATGEPPRLIHQEAESLDTHNKGTAPGQSLGTTLSTPATTPQGWEPAPQLTPQGQGLTGTASFAQPPAEPLFRAPPISYGQHIPPIAPQAEAPPPQAQLPELHFPAVAWPDPTPRSPAPAPGGWQAAPAAPQGFATAPFSAPASPIPTTLAPGPGPAITTPASPLQLPPPPQFATEQQMPVYSKPEASFGAAAPLTSNSYFTPASTPEIAPAPPPAFAPAPAPPQGFVTPAPVTPPPPAATSAPSAFAGPSHPSGWGPPASSVATPPWSLGAIQPNHPSPEQQVHSPLAPPPPSSPELSGNNPLTRPAAPPANTPLAFFGIPAQEEPVEANPEDATLPAEKLPPIQPAPFSWPPQQPSPEIHQAVPSNSLSWAPGAPPIAHAAHEIAHHPIPPAEPVNHPPPMWPGLGLEGSDQRNHPFANLFAREPSHTANQISPASGGLGGTAPAPSTKRTSPVLVFLLLAIIGGTFWYVWKHRAKLLKLAPSSQTETIMPPPALELVPATPAPTLEPSLDPLEAATPDITHNIAAADRAAALVKTLDAANSEEDRLKVISHAQDHKADVKRFFDAIGNQLKPILLDPTPAVVSPLLSGPKLRLFRLVTATCSKGAILHLEAGPNDTQLLDWPLFMQTHEQQFDKFVKSNPPPEQRKAEWFSVLCKRRHDFDLPKDTQDAYICLEAQGSLSPEGSTVLYVNKGLPAGRLLETHLKWAEIYLVDLLVGKAEIGGNPTHVVLDCSGTDTARK